MISFKHILITFTILSASFWFVPVTSVPESSSEPEVTSVTLSQKIDTCVDLIENYTHYKNKSKDFNNIKFVDEDTRNEIDSKINRIQFPDTFSNMMRQQGVDKDKYCQIEQKVKLIIALQNDYSDYLQRNNNKTVDDFCNSKITEDANRYIADTVLRLFNV